MRRPRVSIAGLMGAVAAAAVGLAALRFSTPGWSGSIYLLTRAILGLAILLALYRRGPSRAWWAGFALFGRGYEWLITPMIRYFPPFLPTVRLLLAAKPLLFHPLDVNLGGSSGRLPSPFGKLYETTSTCGSATTCGRWRPRCSARRWRGSLAGRSIGSSPSLCRRRRRAEPVGCVEGGS